jgi:hypothetical protein
MLVILSPASVNSKNVMAEVAFALDEEKEIIPVLYRECKIPFRLRPIQYVDFRREQDYPAALQELLETVGIEERHGQATSAIAMAAGAGEASVPSAEGPKLDVPTHRPPEALKSRSTVNPIAELPLVARPTPSTLTPVRVAFAIAVLVLLVAGGLTWYALQRKSQPKSLLNQQAANTAGGSQMPQVSKQSGPSFAEPPPKDTGQQVSSAPQTQKQTEATVDPRGSEPIFQRAKDLFADNRFTEAFPLLQESASNGNAEAMKDIGWMYDKGKGVEQNYEQARQWYERAAAAGNAIAMNNLAWLYERGLGVQQDYAQARQRYEKAAAAGSASAMNNLGTLFYFGNGVDQDYTEARKWFEKAAARGNHYAMNSLGNLYYFGRGVPKDYAKARQWYEQAVAAGDSDAKDNLKKKFPS